MNNSILKIGVWIGSTSKLNSNGASSYFNAIQNILLENNVQGAKIRFVTNTKEFKNSGDYIYFNLSKALFVHSIFRFISKILIHFPKVYLLQNLIQKIYNRILIPLSSEIDIIYYIIPEEKIIPDFPYIFTVWDIGHLSTFAFPELVMNNSFEYRQNFYKNNLKKAFAIFSESEAGKSDLINYMNIFPHKIFVLPMLPSEVVLDKVVSQKPSFFIDGDFIHYPAHFWAHKNHYNLILAFKMLLNDFNINLVLSGVDHGSKAKILNLISELQIGSHVLIVDRFSIFELKWVYLNSKALVYSSLFGPTNMPIIEAYELNCPVVCSDLPGHFEQVGNYAEYFDPSSPDGIYEAIKRSFAKSDLKVNKKEFNSTAVFLSSLQDSLSKIKSLRKTW